MSFKAFDLVPVIHKLDFKVTCLESCGNDIYLGSDDGLIVRYGVEESMDSSDRVTYTANEICRHITVTRKQVQQLKDSTALQRLLVLSDGCLFLLDSEILSPVSCVMKSVLLFTVNENPFILDPFTLQLCVGKKRSLLICNLHEDKLSVSKEISLHDPPFAMAMDGNCICIAGASGYCVCWADQNNKLDLFPLDDVDGLPFVRRIGKDEFLVMGPGNLGMFVTSAGTSERPPIQWSEGVISVCCYQTYILTLSLEFIRVYSLIDQQHKQTIPISSAGLIGNFDGQLYVSTSTSLFCVMPQPWTSQVQCLLDSECVEEAIELTEHSCAAGLSSTQYVGFIQNVFQRCGFIKFSQGKFAQSQDLFNRGRVDIRELISLFPGLLPRSSSFTRAHPPLHRIADVHQIFHGDQLQVKEAAECLKGFLLQLRSSQEPIDCRLELDTALIKLYSEEKSHDLLVFLESGDIMCDLKECEEWLSAREQYTSLATLYRTQGSVPKCLDILSKLVLGELSDSLFPGIGLLVDAIISSKDASYVWRFADFVLEKDPGEGIRMFTEAEVDIDPDKALSVLLKHPQSRVDYLYHIINTGKVKDEKYHTELVLHYVDCVEGLNAQGGQQSEKSREALLSLLEASQHYNAQAILARLFASSLLEEKVIVYGKLGQHEKALEILVYELGDFPRAQKYCEKHSSENDGFRGSEIYLTLLKIYLKPKPGHMSDDIEVAAALDLLSTYAWQLDLREVLDILPTHWSMCLMQNYLRAAIRSSMHKSRVTRLQNALTRCLSLQQKYNHCSHCKEMGPIIVSENRLCCICDKSFTSPNFVLYPNGVMVHRECMTSRSVCPLTGTVFTVAKENPP